MFLFSDPNQEDTLSLHSYNKTPKEALCEPRTVYFPSVYATTTEACDDEYRINTNTIARIHRKPHLNHVYDVPNRYQKGLVHIMD